MEPRRGKNFLVTLALVVMAVFVVTSGLVGFRLGRNAVSGTGALVDTIVLSPDQSLAQGRAEITHFLSGRLLLSSGDPCGAATVRLLESGKTDETDDRGKFFFSDVRTGTNTLEVLDGDGALLGTSTLTLDFQEDAAAQVDAALPEAPALTLPEDVRMLEVTLTLDPEQHSVAFEEGSSCAVTMEGNVVNFSGQALTLSEGSVSVVPGGDLVTSEGYVVIPSKALAITPWGGQQTLPPAANADGPDAAGADPDDPVSGAEPASAVPGVAIDEEGGVLLENGVEVKPDGVVTTPNEETVGPTEDVVLIPPTGEVEVLPEMPEVYEPAAPDAAAPEKLPAEETANAEQANGPEGAPAESPEEPAPAQEPSPEPTPEPTPEPVSISWSQQSMVDLFANRTSGEELGTQQVYDADTKQMKEVPVIAPGSSGYYDFNLKNDADYNIRFTLSISEGSFHLPILYSVRDLETNYVYQGGSKVFTDGSAISTDYITLPPHSQRSYRLGWEWQMDDWLAPWWDNTFDTAAAGRDDRTYMVSVEIHAEQAYRANKKK